MLLEKRGEALRPNTVLFHAMSQQGPVATGTMEASCAHCSVNSPLR